MDNPLFAQNRNNFMPLLLWSLGPFFPITPFHFSTSTPTCALKSPINMTHVPQHNVHSLKLWQQVEVDSENEVEKLKIPSFGPNRPALIIHDFRKNVTIITDLTGRRCFLKPLDEHIAPPANLIDLVRKFERGYYEPDIKVLREDYEVSSAPLTEEELNESPPFLFKEIKSFPVYWLKSTKPKNRYRLLPNAPYKVPQTGCLVVFLPSYTE
ncbi:unnamed protein product [Soboliphyme baturini]|uniref:Integral membrane protein 2 n=1 Tax=Soboliphyme baturini TaxID=241478 RepID=A0A183J330_9BILA|nr:unnamed protein product [Soboliphyme baturini]